MTLTDRLTGGDGARIGSDAALDVFVEWAGERGFALYPAQEEAVLALADGSRLFLQCTHKGDGGLTALTTGDVSIRVPTEQNADLVGLSQFTYQEPVPFGSARFL